MGYTWTAALSGVLSAALTYFLSFETLSTPVAMKLSQCAVTSSYVTGFVYKTTLLVRISQTGREPSQSVVSSLWPCTSCSALAYATCLLLVWKQIYPRTRSCYGRCMLLYN